MEISCFEELISIIKNNTYDELLEKIDQNKNRNARKKRYIKAAKKELVSRKKGIIEHFNIWSGKYDRQLEEWFNWTQCESVSYNKYFKLLLKDLYENIEKYEEVYNILCDEESKRCFLDICIWRLTMESKYLIEAYSQSRNEQYLEDFEKLNSNEIFVDCGGYIGDSTLALIEYVGRICKAYIYEADVANMEKAKQNLVSLNNIVFRGVGVGDKNEKLFFSELGSSASSFVVEGEHGNSIDVVSIDDDLPMEEKITFIKMDIEGMEMEALCGAKNHIQSYRPVLAVCLYHKVEDIWKLPIFIREMVKNGYKFYLRHYTLYHGETVFYAIPIERK